MSDLCYSSFESIQKQLKVLNQNLNSKYDIQLSTEFNHLVSYMLIVCTKNSYPTKYLAEVACRDAMSPVEYELRLIAEEIAN
ncbi:hypothetical protein C7B62_12625 [Pleurocapsa sp. CCALA 161]|uniref:hypothetical protein n=1 Tax=Pleurocapsa sp. CCALA 161 TaxID=2107688 RepID=UPI000D07ED97|nr:hypothetical protein [Pleurocapsa sp. CCALA 161]PSB09626.1 hypothetical protein C7B62_12625 [Pleurocapsa sp. CCALA 161]